MCSHWQSIFGRTYRKARSLVVCGKTCQAGGQGWEGEFLFCRSTVSCLQLWKPSGIHFFCFVLFCSFIRFVPNLWDQNLTWSVIKLLRYSLNSYSSGRNVRVTAWYTIYVRHTSLTFLKYEKFWIPKHIQQDYGSMYPLNFECNLYSSISVFFWNLKPMKGLPIQKIKFKKNFKLNLAWCLTQSKLSVNMGSCCYSILPGLSCQQICSCPVVHFTVTADPVTVTT